MTSIYSLAQSFNGRWTGHFFWKLRFYVLYESFGCCLNLNLKWLYIRCAKFRLHLEAETIDGKRMRLCENDNLGQSNCCCCWGFYGSKNAIIFPKKESLVFHMIVPGPRHWIQRSDTSNTCTYFKYTNNNNNSDEWKFFLILNSMHDASVKWMNASRMTRVWTLMSILSDSRRRIHDYFLQKFSLWAKQDWNQKQFQASSKIK